MHEFWQVLGLQLYKPSLKLHRCRLLWNDIYGFWVQPGFFLWLSDMKRNYRHQFFPQEVEGWSRGWKWGEPELEIVWTGCLFHRSWTESVDAWYMPLLKAQNYPVHLRYVISGNCRDATWSTLGNFPLVWVIFRVSEQINSTAIVRCGTTLICRHSGVLIFLFLYHLFFICPSSLIVFLRSQKWMMKSDDPEWTGLF